MFLTPSDKCQIGTLYRAIFVAGPVGEQELEISPDTFLHRVKYTEVGGDRCVMSGRIFLAGAEVYALSGPKSAALETEEVVVFFAKARFAGRTLQDRLRDDGAVSIFSLEISFA